MKELLRQTVTVFRQKNGKLTRTVYENAHFQQRDKLVRDEMGAYTQGEFLLILPPEADLRPGDRVVAGNAPEAENWESLMRPPFEAVELRRCELCHLEGKPHHVEGS